MEHGLSKQLTKAVYGFAILIMIYHHLFLDPNRLNIMYYSVLNIKVGTVALEQLLAWFCKICVAIYAFISGYGLYRSASGNKYVKPTIRLKENYKYVLKHCLQLLKKFWVVYFVFIPFIIAFEIDGSILSNFIDMLLSMLGLSPKFNSAWWYIKQYFFMLLLYPLIDFMFLNIKDAGLHVVQQALRCIALIIFFGVHFSSSIARIWQLLGSYNIVYRYIEVFIIGYICSKYLIFEKVSKIMKKNEKLSVVLCAICLLVCVCIRCYFCRSASDIKLDAIIIAPFIYCIAYLFEHIPNLKRFFQYFGGYSTYMWLVHIFFIYRFGSFLVTFSHISILMYISAIIVSVLSAKVLCKIEKVIYNRFTVCKKSAGC